MVRAREGRVGGILDYSGDTVSCFVVTSRPYPSADVTQVAFVDTNGFSWYQAADQPVPFESTPPMPEEEEELRPIEPLKAGERYLDI